MTDEQVLNYEIKDPLELNLSYMPFITNGGLFVPTPNAFVLGDKVTINLSLPGKKDHLPIEGRVVWITPKNALHLVLPGIGVQFIGNNAHTVRTQIESQLDKTIEVGGYTYGITEWTKGEKK